jgi:hypothetical protein
MNWIWDYDIPKNWRPKTAAQWAWFLVRKINYGDFQGLNRDAVKKYFSRIKTLLDLGKKAMLENFLKIKKTWLCLTPGVKHLN